MSLQFTYQELKERQRSLRDGFCEALSLRTHRALSWLNRAEQESHDQDARFIFLWIAFNAAYANDIPDRAGFSEKKLLLRFVGQLVDTDKQNYLYTLVWNHFPVSIRTLIANQYVFQPYWDFQSGRRTEEEWLDQFASSKRTATRALGRMQTKKLMAVVFDRLYVLRNQLIHGCSTWGGGVNRQQVTDGAQIMSLVVPIIIHLMMENPNRLWGDPRYPVVS
jgi:hypothetical protein